MKHALAVVALLLVAGCSTSTDNITTSAGSKSSIAVAANRQCYGYFYGVGLPQDDKLAFQWCGFGAKLGDSNSQTLLAEILLQGHSRAAIEPDGTVSNPAIQGSPPSELAALTLNATMRWKFTPAMKDGAPVRVRAQQEFVFKVR